MEELEPWRETPGYTDAPKASPPDPEVGSEIALELLHHVIEKGGELARPLDIGAFPAPLRLMGEETLMMYVPVIEQVAFLHLQDLR